MAEKWLSALSSKASQHAGGPQMLLLTLLVVFAIAGTCGLILLSIFDTLRHPRLHDGFLLLFMYVFVIQSLTELLMVDCRSVPDTLSQPYSYAPNISASAFTSGNIES